MNAPTPLDADRFSPSLAEELAVRLVDSNLDGLEVEAEVELRVLVIGRASSSDVHIADPKVSRRHAELRTPPLAVRDLGSSNGTRIERDGRVMDVGTIEFTELQPGDRVFTKDVLLYTAPVT